jgi:hypothetical protein
LNADVLSIDAVGFERRVVHLRRARVRDGIADHSEPCRRSEMVLVGGPVLKVGEGDEVRHDG